MDTKIPQSPSPPQCRAAQCSSVHSLMSLQKPQSSLWPTIVSVCQGPWASLAPQLQVINAVLEIKILNWASLEAAQQGLRYCLVSPRQPGWLPGLSGAARSTCHELPTWGFVLSNGGGLLFPLPARECLLLQAATSCRRLLKVGDRFAEQEFSEHQAKEM